MKSPLLTVLISIVLVKSTFSQECWQPKIPISKSPHYSYIVGVGSGTNTEIAKKNAALDALKQAGETLKLSYSNEISSKLETLRNNKNVNESNAIQEIIRISSDETFENFKRIDICESSFNKDSKVYLLYRLPKKGSPGEPDSDYKEFTYMKMGIAPIIPGLAQWKKSQRSKSLIYPLVIGSGLTGGFILNSMANRDDSKATNFYGSNPIYNERFKNYAKNERLGSVISLGIAGVAYIFNIYDGYKLNIPKLYANNNVNLNYSFEKAGLLVKFSF